MSDFKSRFTKFFQSPQHSNIPQAPLQQQKEQDPHRHQTHHHSTMSPSTKRGISVPWDFPASDFALYEKAISSGKIHWCSNWEMWKPQGLPSSLPFIPQCRTGDAANQIPNYLTEYHSNSDSTFDLALIGFNEPDIIDQANMAVSQAVSLWKQHVLPTKTELSSVQGKPPLTLGSPAISNGPNGLPWLKSFISDLSGLQASGIDVIVIHYYSPSVSHFKSYVQEVYDTFHKPIWVTEFACTDFNPNANRSEEEVMAFMKEAVGFLEEMDYVEKYAWFGSMRDVGGGVGRANGLEEADGKRLSRVGELYVSL